MYTYGFKLHIEVMLAPTNYFSLYQELCLFARLQACKNLFSALLSSN